MRRVIQGALAALLVAAPMVADASITILNFGEDAKNNGERAFADGDGRTINGVDVKFIAGKNKTEADTGFDLNGGTSAYLDGYSNSKPAGLGACSTVKTNNQCGTSSDDNTGLSGDVDSGYFEWTGFYLDSDYRVEDIKFRNRDHNVLKDFTIDLYLGGTDLVSSYAWDFTVGDGISGADLIAAFGTNVLDAGAYLAFGRSDDDGAKDFYVQSVSISAVPLPATFAMLALGLGGFGVMRRRQKAA